MTAARNFFSRILSPKKTGSKGLRIPDGDLLLLLMVPVFFHLWIASPHFYVDRDSIFAFQTFYNFYSHYLAHDSIPRWLPYGSFGIQADFFLTGSFTYTMRLSFLLGKLLNLRDALLVYKADALIGQLLMLSGMYFFVKRWIHHRLAVVATVLLLAGSTIWFFQVIWNFRIFALLPWMLLCLTLFYENRRPCWIFAAGIFFVMSQLGVPPYMVLMHFFIGVTFLLALDPVRFFDFRWVLKMKLLDTAAALLFVVCCGLYLYFFSHMLDGTLSLFSGRDPLTHAVSYRDFIEAGTGIGFGKFAGLVLANSAKEDSTIYIGLLPLVFVPYALFFNRSVCVRAAAGIVLYLALLSAGPETPVARWTYDWIPPMRYYRYIGIMHGFLRLFLVLLAGLGFDRYLLDREQERGAGRRLFLCGGIGLGGAGIVYALHVLGGHFLEQWPALFPGAFGLAAAAVLSGLIRSKGGRLIPLVFGLAFALDILAYQSLFTGTWGYRFPWLNSEITGVAPIRYLPSRNPEDFKGDPRVPQAERLTECCGYRLAKEIYGFLQIDSCVPRNFPNFQWRTDFVEMVMARFPLFIQSDTLESFLEAPETPLFLKLGSCHDDKLRLTGEAVPVTNRQEAVYVFRTLERPDLTPVLEAVPPEVSARWQSRPDIADAFLKVTGYSYNRTVIQVSEVPPGGLWLMNAENFHPGWRARIDQSPAKVVRANLAFMAVYVPEGTHAVTLEFWDGFQSLAGILLYMIGGLLSAVLLLVTLGALLGIFPAGDLPSKNLSGMSLLKSK